jgi:hypothetical protein
LKEKKKYGGLCINKYVHELTQLTIIRILAIFHVKFGRHCMLNVAAGIRNVDRKGEDRMVRMWTVKIFSLQ